VCHVVCPRIPWSCVMTLQKILMPKRKNFDLELQSRSFQYIWQNPPRNITGACNNVPCLFLQLRHEMSTKYYETKEVFFIETSHTLLTSPLFITHAADLPAVHHTRCWPPRCSSHTLLTSPLSITLAADLPAVHHTRCWPPRCSSHTLLTSPPRFIVIPNRSKLPIISTVYTTSSLY